MLNDSKVATEDQDQGNGHTPNQTPAKDQDARLTDLEKQIADLKQKLGLARGTQDNVSAPVQSADVLVKIEQTLRARVCTTEELAKLINEPVHKVQEKLKTIRKNLADIGTPDQAKWVWRIGDDAPAAELRALVARLIEGRTMTTQELTRITGARMSRVNGVIVDLQRDPELKDRIWNLGSRYRARWLIVPKNAIPASLPRKNA